MTEPGIRPDVSATRWWGWVFGGGLVMGLLATFQPLEDGAWWLVTSTVGAVWGLPYVRVVAAVLAVVGAVAVAVRMWRGRHW